MIRVKSAAQLHQEGRNSTDPLQDHPSAQQTGKNKVKCVKASIKDFTISFSEYISMGDVANKASSVLVGHVQGRAYTTERLTCWVQDPLGPGNLAQYPQRIAGGPGSS